MSKGPASTFARDIERYPTDEAVPACPPSVWYRFRKFAHKNRTTAAIGEALAKVDTLRGQRGRSVQFIGGVNRFVLTVNPLRDPKAAALQRFWLFCC